MHRALFIACHLLFALCCSSSFALAPHELLLLVNQNSPRSLELANRYTALRGVPPENIVALDVPDSARAPAAEISPADFTRYIWQPLDQALRERGLLGRILAVAYSADFPVRVTTSPPMSLTGLTFTRNQVPPSGLITTGSFRSVFFAGPFQANGPTAGSRSLGWFRAAAPQQLLPLPAMLLAHTGARGLELDEVFQGLEKAAQPFSKSWTCPPKLERRWENAAFYFITSDDIRSKMRAWQFPAAQAELAALGMTAIITNAPPAVAPGAMAGTPVLGLLCGTAWPAPPRFSFAPGAYADHLTSFGALFHSADQTKLTLWPRAGATLTSGTVSEPYSIWTKFPNARFFAHQVRGCSAIECFALSTFCPFQLLPVGDPLAAPFAPPLTARLGVHSVSNQLAAMLTVTGAPTNVVLRYSFFLDGRCLEHDANRPGLIFNTAQLPDGPHRLLAVAEFGDEIRFSAQATAKFARDHMQLTPITAEERPFVRAVPPPEPPGFQGLEKFSADFPTLGKLERKSTGAISFSASNGCAIAGASVAAQEIAVTLTPTAASLTQPARAGLVFNVRDEKNFDFFGLIGETSGWTLAHVRDGDFHIVVARGAPVRIGSDYRLGVRTGTNGVEYLVNREQILRDEKMRLENAPLGLGVSGPGATFVGLGWRPQR
ncbi:MAG: hypothetical protein EPN23_02935 [Verrucomicrobia bacterium]|nr:MAG: hypothetical protein EPN23_02935 [Verrucomicrobiota bacterium]